MKEEIVQHTIKNWDWSKNWVFTDYRFSLTHCSDEFYLDFLTDVFSPDVVCDEVREGSKEYSLLVSVNSLLNIDGYEIYQSGEISGCPTFKWQRLDLLEQTMRNQLEELKDSFNSQYIDSQIHSIESLIRNNPTDAIGKAKELIESCCKTILDKQGIEFVSGWTLSQLFKETRKHIRFSDNSGNLNDTNKLLSQILSSLTGIVSNLGELRNKCGGGHGKSADFVAVDSSYAQLAVAASTAIVHFIWTQYNLKKIES